MLPIRTILTSMALAASAGVAGAQEGDINAMLAEGRAIAEERCAICHAIGPQDESPEPAAPAFRTLSQRYPVDDLQEALAEGLTTGHPTMPEVVLQPEQIDAFLAYLKSIQEPATP